MIPEGILRTVRNLRREHPEYGTRSLLGMARARWGSLPDGWDESSNHHGDTFITGTRDGFDIKLTVAYDEYDYNGSEQYGTFSVTYRDGTRTETFTSEYGLDSYYNDGRRYHGMSRSVARDYATRMVERDERMAREYVSYIVTATASREGIELGEGNVGGVDFDSDANLSTQAYAYAEDADIIGEAIADARTHLTSLCQSSQGTAS